MSDQYQHHHHHHHAKSPTNNWDASYDSFQDSSFNNGYMYFLDPPKRNHVAEHHQEPPICVKLGDKEICSESVDTVAEEFIKLEHKRF
uniref:Uncharacterized protein n=1 Tax=Manihot esculenta TaxID=3983 RepID=A0A2C9UU35_MANES